MRRPLAIAALVLTAGCDDPAVQGKVLGALDHGVVEAYAVCYTPAASTIDYGNVGNLGSALGPLELHVSKFLDGSAMVSFYSNQHRLQLRSTMFAPRGFVDPAFSIAFDNGPCDADIVSRLEAGNWNLYQEDKQSSCPDYPETVFFTGAIETYCTGFNLEAF